MTLPALATLLLCLFSAVLLAARPVLPVRAALLLVPAFLAGLGLASLIFPGYAAIALYAGAATAVSLLGAPRPRLALLLSGSAAGLAAATLFPFAELGAVAVLAAIVMLAAVLASQHLAWRDAAFAPASLRDQGGCAIVITAPVVAALPGAEAGWQSAVALAGAQAQTGAPAVGGWLALPLLALVFGGLHQLLVRR